MHDVILQADCIETMRAMPAESVDMIFADPPYNMQLRDKLKRPDESDVAGVHNEWDKFSSFEEYDRFTREWLSAARRILKPNGTIWVIGSYHNVFRLGVALQDLDFWILNDVVWKKTNPMPNFRGRRLTNAHETLIWAAKSQSSSYRFNYESAKAGNDDVQLRSDWSFSICSGSERLKTAGGTSLHPTQKPEALLRRILSLSTAPGDLVVDPFSGTGTTCAVAKAMARHYVGIEKEAEYVTQSRVRVASTIALPSESTAVPSSRRDALRVPFSALLDAELVEAGAELVCPTGANRAIVRIDGSLSVNGTVLSIHQAAAKAMGRQSFNGWAYWHLKGQDRNVPIESLREEIRRRLSSTVEAAA